MLSHDRCSCGPLHTPPRATLEAWDAACHVSTCMLPLTAPAVLPRLFYYATQDAAVEASPRLKRSDRTAMLLPETRVAEVGHALLCALHHLHSMGYAHCDIKPDNILIMADGSVRLGDPGVATAADASGRLPTPAGTYAYCSVEMRAMIDKEACVYPVTCQTDMPGLAKVLALCAVWHDNLSAWGEYAHWERDLPECVPEGLQELIGSMMAKDPTKRPTPLEALGNEWLMETMRLARWQRVQQKQQQQQEEAPGKGGVVTAAATTAPEAAVAAGAGAGAGAGTISPADAWW